MRKYILLVGDLIILLAGLWLTLLVRYQQSFTKEYWDSHLLPFTAIFFILIVVFYIDNLYEISINKGFELFNRLIRSVVIGGAFGIVFFYLGSGRLFTIRPQRVLLIYLLITGLLVYLWRLLFGRLARLPIISQGIAIIGFNSLTQEIMEELGKKPELGLTVKALIPADPAQKETIPAAFRQLLVAPGIDQLKLICQEKNIKTIISTIHPRENRQLLKSLFECLPLKINFFEAASFYEKITGKIPVTTIEEIWFLENLAEGSKKIYDLIKNSLDVLLSLILFIITLPLFPGLALLIKLDSRGPVFFRQKRTGKDGKIFTVIKFRTMIEKAENNGPQWATKDDPRITRWGGLLRQSRLDELPQLINVIKGEMSLIGPRPERPEFIEQLQKEMPFYKERLLIKPGLTGWAQVVGPAYGGSREESLEKLQYDLFYVKNRSFGLDLNILLKTIRIVLGRQGQ